MQRPFFVNLRGIDSLDTSSLIFANWLLLANLNTVLSLSILNGLQTFFNKKHKYARETILVATFGCQSIKASIVLHATNLRTD